MYKSLKIYIKLLFILEVIFFCFYLYAEIGNEGKQINSNFDNGNLLEKNLSSMESTLLDVPAIDGIIINRSSVFNINPVRSNSPIFNINNQSLTAYFPTLLLLLLLFFLAFVFITNKMRKHYQSRIEQLFEMNEKISEEFGYMKKSYHSFFNQMNHDIKNILNSLQSASSLFHSHYESLDDSDRNTLVESISASTNQLSGFFENITIWASVSSGMLEMEKDEFRIILPVKEIVDNYACALRNKGIKVKLDIPEEATGYFDIPALKILVRNLLTNAIKYSFPNGEIEINYQKSDSGTSLSVRDYGIGISKADQERLFNLTTIFSNNGTNDEKGAGLGLIICKELLQIHGGNINMKTIENKGSSFTLFFPLKKYPNH